MKRITLLSLVAAMLISVGLYAAGTQTEPLPPADKSDRVGWLKYYHELEQQDRLSKSSALSHRRSGIHNGNRVRTLFYNYGSIGKPNTEPSMEWPIGSNRGYAFEFGVLAGAKVLGYGGDPDDPRDYYPVVSDGLVTAGVTETAPDNTVAGDWQPLPGYHDPFAFTIAMSDVADENRDGKPDSWPNSWYDAFFEDYVWPGEYGKGITTADQESYYIMDDYFVKNYNHYWPTLGEPWSDSLRAGEFYPAPVNDPVRGGLGLEVMARGYQWVSTRAQNVIFFVYELTNVGEDTLKGVYFGMYGDPHIGGANDYSDDDAYYDTFLDMVYAWDDNARGGPEFKQTIPGFFGYKFLESPGEPRDEFDNDEDGIVDESMQDGIDNDGDWRTFTDWNLNGEWDEGEPVNDDLGADGVGPEDPNYPGPDMDGSEVNGIPDHGEPNFDETDLDEADQIGLTGFVVEEYTNSSRTGDYYYNNRLSATIIDSLFQQAQDNIFMYSSGPIVMAPNDTRRFSITMLFGYNITGATGEDLYQDPHNTRDLYATAAVMQEIYDAGYRFVKPPNKPRLTAVAGDEEVTLYWDEGAEKSRDPLYGNDFEGYAIYRATDFGFNESLDITDAYGSPYLWTPIAKFDLDNNLSGPHPIEQIEGSGLHFDVGSNSGLVHSYVDDDVVNGQRYFYAVCAYDSGSVRDTIPPTETAKTIQEDYSGNVSLDVNTAVVIPRAPSVGYVPPDIPMEDQLHDGPGSGRIEFRIIDPTLIPDEKTFEVRFVDSGMDVVDNDGDWQSFVDDTLTFDNGLYLDLVVPPTRDSTIFHLANNDTMVMRADSGETFSHRGQLWLIKTYIEAGTKDTVVIYPMDLELAPTMDVWEPLVDGPVYDDVGVDGCSDEFEDGFGGCLDVATNAVGSDLNQDNWHPVNNPDGTEANGLPNTGEPDVDQNDLEEKMRETQSFTVVDVSDPLNETTVMDNQTALNGEDFNAISNGFQVFVYNDTLKIDEQALTWTNGNSIWEADIEVYESSSIHGVASPNDFRLEFYDHVVDTAVVATLDGLFKTGKPLVVKVYDTIAEEYMDMLQIGVRDSTLEVGSQILPILYQREDKVGDWIPTWRFQFHSPMEVVQEIFELEDGVIAGTAYKGMHIYSEENDTWQSYTMSSTGGGLISNNVSDVKYYDGMFWIATGYGPVFFDGSSWYHNVRLETIFDEWAPDDEKELEDEEKSKKYEGCSAIARDPDGLVWLGSKRNGLVRVNTNGTYDTSMDDSLEFYVTPDSIIEVFDFDDGDLNDLFVDDDRTVWAATNSGIAAYNYQDSTWKTYIKDNVNGLENKKITCIIQLPEEFGNTLVFGTEKGIAFKVGEMFTVYTNTDDYLPHNKVYSLYYRNANELYIGTQDGYAVFDISQANSDFTAGITSELFEASWGNETIYQDSRIRAIEFVGDIGYFGTEQGVEQRLSANEWNTFGPQPGDVFDMSTDKPFSSFDTYQFTTYGGQESASKVADDLSEVAVVPNPYVGAAVWEKKPYLQSGRGERKIYFINLPRDCTIRIYTLAGELVKILEHHDTVYNGQEPWDLLNADNLEIAYGIYVYHIEAENAETVGKFAVIK